MHFKCLKFIPRTKWGIRRETERFRSYRWDLSVHIRFPAIPELFHDGGDEGESLQSAHIGLYVLESLKTGAVLRFSPCGKFLR